MSDRMSTANGSAEDAELDRLLRQAAAEPVHYPPGLVARSLHAVRSARMFTPDEAVGVAQQGGLLTVSRRAVGTLVYRLAAELCSVTGGMRVRDVEVREAIEVGLAVAYGTPMEQVELLRERLTNALTSYLGTTAAQVDLRIEDIYHPYG